MSKNTISAQRTKLKAEIKDLLHQYQTLKQKEISLNSFGLSRPEEMFEIMNSIGMKYAKEGYLEKAEYWLLKSQPLASKNHRLAVILNNNLACIYKGMNNCTKAVEHLQNAQALIYKLKQSGLKSKRYDLLLVDCWLNLTAIYSSQKRHKQALQVVQKAQSLILFNLELGSQKFMEQLLIAKYNKIVQLEHLVKLQQAYQEVNHLRKHMYDQRIYGHFLENKINQIHQQLRTKLFTQNKRKTRTLSCVSSMSKINLELKTHGFEGENKSRRGSSSFRKHEPKPSYRSCKENADIQRYCSLKIKVVPEIKWSSKRKNSLACNSVEHRVSVMQQITNKNTVL